MEITNKIYNGDCLEIMNNIPSKSIDMILCDLPYGVNPLYNWDQIIPLDLLWSQYERIIKDNGAILLFGNKLFFCKLCLSNPKLYRYDLIWEKERPTNIFNMKYQIGRVHENIAVFYKHTPTYNPIMEDRKVITMGVGDLGCATTHKKQKYSYSKGYDKTKIYPRSVIKINRDTLKGSLHPTQKPVALCEYLIKIYTNEGDLVLDNCAGSGTTGVACKNTNRKYILIEKDEHYFNICKTRLE